jgi:hypothetical protein
MSVTNAVLAKSSWPGGAPRERVSHLGQLRLSFAHTLDERLYLYSDLTPDLTPNSEQPWDTRAQPSAGDRLNRIPWDTPEHADGGERRVQAVFKTVAAPGCALHREDRSARGAAKSRA